MSGAQGEFFKEHKCFGCGEWFETKDAEVCEVCGWYICPKCGESLCTLSVEAQKVARIMWEEWTQKVAEAKRDFPFRFKECEELFQHIVPDDPSSPRMVTLCWHCGRYDCCAWLKKTFGGSGSPMPEKENDKRCVAEPKEGGE